jgi:hypothetical protein
MRHEVTRKSSNISSFFEKLFSVPKGFGKFYPKDGAIPKSGGSKSGGSKGGSKREPFGTKGGGNKKGKGGGDKDPFDSALSYLPLFVGTTTMAVALYLLNSGSQG